MTTNTSPGFFQGQSVTPPATPVGIDLPWIDVRDYGAKLDGTTDDTASIQAALNEAATLRLGVYLPTGVAIVSGLSVPTGIISIFGDGNDLSILKRKPAAATTAAVLTIGASSDFSMRDFAVDGNKAYQTVGANNVQISGASDFALIRIRSVSAKSAAGYGAGFVLNSLPSTNATGREVSLRDCEAYGNDGTGLHILRTGAAIAVQGGVYSDNSGTGIQYDQQGIPPVADTVPNLRVIGARAERNAGSGISAGGFTVVGLGGTQTYGHGSDPAYGTIISGCQANYNAGYGIFVQGTGVSITGNTVRGNGTTNQGGICANSQSVVVANNIVHANKYYGIDAGGILYGTISGNQIWGTDDGSGSGTGLNLGASQNVVVQGNTLKDNGNTQIYIPRNDSGVYWFPWDASDITVDNNTIIETRSTNNFGILTAGLPENISITNNKITWVDTTAYNAIRAGLTSGVIRGNILVGNTAGAWGANAATSIVYPEWVDIFAINTDTAPITALLTRSQQQGIEKITAVAMTDRGSGYTADFDVIVTGGGGSGAALRAHVSQDGRVAAVEITNSGSGYTSVPTLDFSNGSGTGAAATAKVGVSNLGGKQLKFLAFGSDFRMTSGTVIRLPAPAGSTITVSNGGTLTLIGAEAVYYADGLSSGNGSLWPTTITMPGGITWTVGTGSPEGVVTAPVGSFFSRSDGGVSTTLYVKQSGTGNTGWVGK